MERRIQPGPAGRAHMGVVGRKERPGAGKTLVNGSADELWPSPAACARRFDGSELTSTTRNADSGRTAPSADRCSGRRWR